MTFEELSIFLRAFGLYPDIVTKHTLLQLYQSFLHNNYDEGTFDIGSLILLLGVVGLQNGTPNEEYSNTQKLLILIEKMSFFQSKIDKNTNQQMKNYANYSSAQRPRDLISVFGPHVI